MAQPNLGQMIKDAWDQILETTEDPFSDPSGIVAEMFGRPRLSYRQQLDRTRINHYGKIIPRIVTVKRNLSMVLADPKLPASRLPL